MLTYLTAGHSYLGKKPKITYEKKEKEKKTACLKRILVPFTLYLITTCLWYILIREEYNHLYLCIDKCEKPNRCFLLHISSDASLWKTSRQLIWSVFGLTDLQEMESHSSFTSQTVAILYLIFLVLTVIMLVNMLVALLTNTYDNVTVRSTSNNL